MKKYLLLCAFIFIMGCGTHPHFDVPGQIKEKVIKTYSNKDELGSPYAIYKMSNTRWSINDAKFFGPPEFAKVGDWVGYKNGVITVLRGE